MKHTQKNKATSFHLGILKAKLAKLRQEVLEPKNKSGAAGPGEGFDAPKTGDARVGLIGFPSVGKSTLLNVLTNTYSAVAAYEFTTLTCVPGVIHYKGAKIQLLDLPGIIEGARFGKGRGRQVIAVGRTCSLVLIVLDALHPLTHKRIIEGELEGFGIRLNKKPPNVVYRKKDKGGVSISSTVKLTHLDEETIKAICAEYRIHNADFNFHCNATADDLIDIIEGNRVYIPCLYVLNKIDQLTIEALDVLSRTPHVVPISAHLQWNLDDLLEKMWDYLNMLRIYTKPPGQVPDYTSPIIIQNDKPTIEKFCNKIHKAIMPAFKYALVWGTSVKFNPQRCGKDHELNDEDIVQIVKN